MNDVLLETWNQTKKSTLIVVGIVSIAVGVVLLAVPLIPGWPFFVFGAYCLKIANED